MTAKPTKGQRAAAALALFSAAVFVTGLAGLGTVAVMGWAAGIGSPEGLTDPTVFLFMVVSLAPHAFMCGLAKWVLESTDVVSGAIVVAGSLAFAALSAAFLYNFVVSESSTAALGFLIMPVFLGVVVGVVALVVWARKRPATGPGSSKS